MTNWRGKKEKKEQNQMERNRDFSLKTKTTSNYDLLVIKYYIFLF